jgi:hypothetical protein
VDPHINLKIVIPLHQYIGNITESVGYDTSVVISGGSSDWRSGDRHPLGISIFSFFLHKNEKIRVILPRIGFENRFFSIVATPH